MKTVIALALAASAQALVARSDSCCFTLTASGGDSGTLGQLTDGQVRVGDDTLSAATFCLADGIITDSEGRGCVITEETTQFQCDEGATGTYGFTLSSTTLEFDGSAAFIACATGENNGDNIYTTNSTSVTECVSIELTADSTCSASSSAAASSVVAATTVVPVPVSSSAPVSVTSIPVSVPSAASTPVAVIPGSSAVVTASSVASSVASSSTSSSSSSSSSSGSTSGSGSTTSSTTSSSSSSSVAPTSGAASLSSSSLIQAIVLGLSAYLMI